MINVTIPDSLPAALVLGQDDCLLRTVQDKFSTRITVRGNSIDIDGNTIECAQLSTVFTELIRLAQSGEVLTPSDVERLIELTRCSDCAPKALRDDVLYSFQGRAVRPKTAGQKAYVDAIRSHSITFALGPAGTGKTYLAMAMAMAALKRKEITRIVLTRPVVEAGENLGFLPGTLTEKIDPYMRPLYDALSDMMDPVQINDLLSNDVIEIAPLAFMRGRTLNNAFVILDEAQNTTQEQMKMFLTRLGFGSKMVITGDRSQSDIPLRSSGLLQACSVLEEVDDIAFCTLTGNDVVRHSLVAAIVAAYEHAQEKE